MQPTSLNEIKIEMHDAGAAIRKVYRAKPSSLKQWRYKLLRPVLTAPVEYWSPQERCRFEAQTLETWHRAGFRVPRVLEKLDDQLLLEYIDAPTLKEFLPTVSTDEAAECIDQLFIENAERHAQALRENCHALVHYDSNLRNHLQSASGVVHIDFEMGHLREPILRSVNRENLKLLLELAKLLGRSSLPQLCRQFCDRYTGLPCVHAMLEEQNQRSLAAFHVWKDKRKRRADRITQGEVLEALTCSALEETL